MGKVGKRETGSFFLLACFPSSLLFLRVFFTAGLTAHSYCTVRFLRVSLWAPGIGAWRCLRDARAVGGIRGHRRRAGADGCGVDSGIFK